MVWVLSFGLKVKRFGARRRWVYRLVCCDAAGLRGVSVPLRQVFDAAATEC
jgi:hypothetical protein